MAPRSDAWVGDEEWRSSDPQRVETLRLAEIVMAIISSRPAVPWASAAAISREKRGGEFLVHVRLLERDLPLSEGAEESALTDHSKIIAVFSAAHLGKDLEDAFAGNDVMVLR
jgi:hypothetical protein